MTQDIEYIRAYGSDNHAQAWAQLFLAEAEVGNRILSTQYFDFVS